MDQDARPLARGRFYRVLDDGRFLVLEDSTRDGLTVQGRSADGGMMGVEADTGIIHGMDGVGRRVPIRWYFPKGEHDPGVVLARAQEMEDRYSKMRGQGCPGG